MMTRLIDTMNADELSAFLDNIAATEGAPCPFSDVEVRQELERLFAEEPHWSDSLSIVDNQSWVLCYLSDDSPEETWHVDWVGSVTHGWYISVAYKNDCDSWKYATPVDLNVRFRKEIKQLLD